MPVSAAVASPRRAEMAQGAQHRAGLSVAVVRLLAVALDIKYHLAIAEEVGDPSLLSLPSGRVRVRGAEPVADELQQGGLA